jgi:hypothetical protein
MAKYVVPAKVKVRLPNPNNRSGVSWLKQNTVILEGETIEELIEQAYAVPIPQDIDIEAIVVEAMHTHWMDDQVRSRKSFTITAFREL